MKLILWLLLLAAPAAFADGLQVGGGKLFNNENRDHPGWIVDAAYVKGPIQFSVSKVNDSYMDSEINASLVYLLRHNRWSIGGGVIVSHSYKVPQWWFDQGGAQGWGVHAQCLFCGTVGQLGFQITSRIEFQVRYWATERFLIPSHNGALGVLSWKL